jgi:hypothetical protein
MLDNSSPFLMGQVTTLIYLSLYSEITPIYNSLF